MTASEALKACVDALGITDELDAVLKKTMIEILTRVQEESDAEEFPARPAKRRGRPRKEGNTDDTNDK